MFDDDEDIIDIDEDDIEAEDKPVYEIIEDDDEDFDDEEFQEESDDPYRAKGKGDRAFVDQQRQEYDDERRKKRAEIARLRMKLQTLKGRISKKERELRDLDIQLEKEDYREMKERVVQARKDVENHAEGGATPDNETENSPISAPGIEFSGTDMDEEVLSPAMQKRVEREAKRARRRELEEEITRMKQEASEEERVVSQLEHQFLRS